MATLKDIAEHCNLSISLVSKVLNNRLGTSGATEANIRAIRVAARELGYRKNASAEALRRGRHDLVGILLHRPGTVGSGLLEDLVQGLADQLNEYHQRQFITFALDSQVFRQQLPQMHRGNIDGLICGVVPHRDLFPQLSRIRSEGLPVVTVHDDDPKLPGVVNIGLDNAAASAIATRHLIEQGCRRIAHMHIFDSRADGYLRALREAGIKPSNELVYHVPGCRDFTHRMGDEAVRSWLDRGVHFDGIVAQSDEQAMGALRVLMEAGVRVPQDVKLIGIDDSPFCQFAPVPLSSVCQHMAQRGRLAVQKLHEMIDGHQPQSVVVQPELRPRRSSVSPRATPVESE